MTWIDHQRTVIGQNASMERCMAERVTRPALRYIAKRLCAVRAENVRLRQRVQDLETQVMTLQANLDSVVERGDA